MDETETSLATEEEDIQIEHEPAFSRREEEEEEFWVRLGFRWNGVSYVSNHEELVSDTVYQQLLAEKEQNTNNNNNTNKTLLIVALLRHQTLRWNDGNLLGTKHVSVSGTNVVVVDSDAQEYYSKSLLGDDHHCGTRLTKFLFFSCATAFTSFALAIIFARNTLEFVGTILGHLLVGSLLASYLQYRWWERNLREYRVVVVDGGEPPMLDDESNEVELGRTQESTRHAATTMDAYSRVSYKIIMGISIPAAVDK